MARVGAQPADVIEIVTVRGSDDALGRLGAAALPEAWAGLRLPLHAVGVARTQPLAVRAGTGAKIVLAHDEGGRPELGRQLHRIAPADTDLVTFGRVISRYAKRGREYVDIEVAIIVADEPAEPVWTSWVTFTPTATLGAA